MCQHPNCQVSVEVWGWREYRRGQPGAYGLKVEEEQDNVEVRCPNCGQVYIGQYNAAPKWATKILMEVLPDGPDGCDHGETACEAVGAGGCRCRAAEAE